MPPAPGRTSAHQAQCNHAALLIPFLHAQHALTSMRPCLGQVLSQATLPCVIHQGHYVPFASPVYWAQPHTCMLGTATHLHAGHGHTHLHAGHSYTHLHAEHSPLTLTHHLCPLKQTSTGSHACSPSCAEHSHTPACWTQAALNSLSPAACCCLPVLARQIINDELEVVRFSSQNMLPIIALSTKNATAMVEVEAR